jgi:toxin-antitoxin system PIN domain toxin
VILVDTNLLLYSHVVESPRHEAARTWLDAQLNGPGPVGMPWPSLLGFLRIVTHRRIFERPEPIDVAWGQVRDWLAVDSVWIPAPTARHAEILTDLLGAVQPTGNLIPDAHLAALAVEHGLTLCSTDRDFAQFPGLKWRNPLGD